MTARRREHGRIVLIASFHQRVKEPWSFAGSGKTWRTIAHDFAAANVFQQKTGTANIIMKSLRLCSYTRRCP